MSYNPDIIGFLTKHKNNIVLKLKFLVQLEKVWVYNTLLQEKIEVTIGS